jgi:hypothetical protein
MTTYELSWDPPSPVVRLIHSGTQHDYAKTTVTPDSEYFDISAAWYNHPEPYTSQPLNPLSSPSQHKVPELSYHDSTNSTASIAEGVSTHCPSCGLISSSGGLLAENRFSHICADIAREQECPDTHSPSLAERRASLSRHSPTHHRRRHSSLYEPASQETALHLEPLEQKHKLGQHESGPPEQEPNPLEQEPNPLEQEASPLGQSSSSLEQDSDPSAQELHHTHNNEPDFYTHSLASLNAPLELESNPTKHEPHHIHDKGTDFYAHTLASLVAPLEQDYNLNEQLSDPLDPDIHAINEASPQTAAPSEQKRCCCRHSLPANPPLHNWCSPRGV